MTCIPARFVFGNATLRSLIRSSNYIGDLDWLAYEHRSRFCRWPAESPVVIELEPTQLYDVDTVALSRHNLSKMATIKVERINSSGTIMDTVDIKRFDETAPMVRRVGIDWRPGIDTFCGASIADIEPWPDTIPVWLPVMDERAPSVVRITINDIGNPANKVELGMIFAGKRLELANSIDFGNTLTGLTDGQITQLASGFALRSKLRKKARSFSFSIPSLTPEKDRADFYKADLEYPNEPMFVAGYPSGSMWQQDQYTMIGLLTQSPIYTHENVGMHSTSMTITEV